MAEETEQRIHVSLDDQGKTDLATCMAALAMERDGETISPSRTVREALRRWAKSSGLPDVKARKR